MKKLSFLLIALFLILSGCNQEETNTKEKEKAEQTEGEIVKASTKEKESVFEDLPVPPKTTVDVVNQKLGVYGGKEIFSDEYLEEVEEKIKSLPPLEENASEEELDKYFAYAFSLAAEDYPNPDDLIKKWEFQSSGNPNLPDDRYQFKENYNVEIILDSSGSMAKMIDGQTRMELAKKAINEFLQNVPKEANVSLRVYGHKGTGSDADKVKSCSHIEQVYGFTKYDADSFQKALHQFQPSGWTPIAKSLEESKKSFEKYDAKTNTNLIYLVSDGIETCDGDPVAIAKSFADSNVSPIINVIGFDADAKAQEQLQEVARSADGIYTTVTNGDQLKEEFNKAQEVLERWEDWKSDSIIDAEAEKVERSIDILDFSNEWALKEYNQSNLGYIINMMREFDIVNNEQRKKLREKYNDLDELTRQSKKELVEMLKDLNVEKLEETKKEINEKYNQNT